MALSMTGLAVAAVLVLSPAAPQQSSTRPGPSSIIIVGCVSTGPVASGQYTFRESDGLRQYRLSGRRINRYAGQRVEIVGAEPKPKRLTIRGGLWPSPNAAAQAGALDPARESIARQPGASGPDALNFPEFRVSQLRVVEGGCQ